ALRRRRSPPLPYTTLFRSVLHRILAGAQLTLGIGLASSVLAVFTGSLLGAVAGYFGGATDDIIMRTTDLASALPTLFVILVASRSEEHTSELQSRENLVCR